MDSIIPVGQKNTLAEYMIYFDADNRPPMLDKDLYDFWKSRMELYMQNREHKRMILESIENGPLIWPTVEENGDLWERVQLLMQGTSLTKQERECKLYDAFDKFTQIKGESLQKYYLRFTQLINDTNIYNMKMEQVQVNTKFLNSLPSEWSFVVPVFSLGDDPIPQVQRRQGQRYSSTGYKSNATSSRGNNARGQERVVKCYNCQCERHMARKCTQPKRLRNAAWYKKKTKDLDTYDSDCDDILNAKAVLMANISNYGSDIISEKAQRIKPTLYDGIVISNKHVAIHVIDDEDTLILKEVTRSKMAEKEKDPEAIKQKVSNKPIDYVKLNKIYEDFRKRLVPQQELLADKAVGPLTSADLYPLN
nr:Gag-Pol polyprotein [Tanacetum cinerariifolium]